MRTHSILAIVFIVSASLLSQTSLKHFTFVVTDRAGAPIPQAFVHIQHWDLASGIPGAHRPRLIQYRWLICSCTGISLLSLNQKRPGNDLKPNYVPANFFLVSKNVKLISGTTPQGE
jgi:hypothetical protein